MVDVLQRREVLMTDEKWEEILEMDNPDFQKLMVDFKCRDCGDILPVDAAKAGDRLILVGEEKIPHTRSIRKIPTDKFRVFQKGGEVRAVCLECAKKYA